MVAVYENLEKGGNYTYKEQFPIPRHELICLIIISSLQARLDQMVGAQVDLLARVLVKQVTQFIVCSVPSAV